MHVHHACVHRDEGNHFPNGACQDMWTSLCTCGRKHTSATCLYHNHRVLQTWTLNSFYAAGRWASTSQCAGTLKPSLPHLRDQSRGKMLHMRAVWGSCCYLPARSWWEASLPAGIVIKETTVFLWDPFLFSSLQDSLTWPLVCWPRDHGPWVRDTKSHIPVVSLSASTTS